MAPRKPRKLGDRKVKVICLLQEDTEVAFATKQEQNERADMDHAGLRCIAASLVHEEHERADKATRVAELQAVREQRFVFVEHLP